MANGNWIETLSTSVFFALVFLFGSKLKSSGKGEKYHRRLISLGAGISVAYVFIHLLPELGSVAETFTEVTKHHGLPFPEFRVHLSVMLGFMLAYGLENLTSRMGENTEEGAGGRKFLFHAGGFAIYVWLVSYLLVRNIEGEKFLWLFMPWL
ncbi:MAG: ZIP family metal transporter [Candidatus Eremiobacteraeota bacterium]|nr:ZIP family metal transporter [Candidatus Eremiobacteraeota bacterium]